MHCTSMTPRTVTRGIDVLREMESLKTIALSAERKFTPEEFWKRYDAGEFKK